MSHSNNILRGDTPLEEQRSGWRWFRRPASRTGRVFHFVLLAIFLLSMFAWGSIALWTPPVGWVWHIFRGNSIAFEGHRIKVPWDMCVFRGDERDVMIIRQGPEHPLFSSPWAVLTFGRIPGPARDLTKGYDVTARLHSLPLPGYGRPSLHEFPAAKGVVVCWDSTAADLSGELIDCRFDGDTLYLMFMGSPHYSDYVYSVVSELSTAPAKSGR